jgi:HEAT repeat protein
VFVRYGLLTSVVCVAVLLLRIPLLSQPALPRPGASPVDALIAEGAINDAVTAFDIESDRTRSVDFRKLERLARAVLSASTSSEDAAAQTEACLTLLADGPHPCEARLGTTQDQPDAAARVRTLALASRGGDDAAVRRVNELSAGFGDQDWTAVIDAAKNLPPAVAVQLLSQAAAKGTPDARFSAVAALATIESPAALPVLRLWARKAHTPGRLIALAAVAGSGDSEALGELQRLLPELEGEDRLAAGTALARRKDPKGIEAIRDVLNGPDELLQLEAAAALARLGDRSGLERLGGELANTNVWIRLRALEKLRGLSLPPTAAVWRQMADPMPWVRVRAAQLTLEGCRRGVDAAAAKR